MKNIFDKEVSSEIIARINKLSSSSNNKWGKMNVGQMLAHMNVAYEMVYETKHKKPTGFKKIILKLIIKPIVVGAKPFKKNGQTAPAFLITNERDFQIEKDRLIAYIEKTQELGANYFDNKESHSFGKLTVNEWNNMFYKHINHHLEQFGV